MDHNLACKPSDIYNTHTGINIKVNVNNGKDKISNAKTTRKKKVVFIVNNIVHLVNIFNHKISPLLFLDAV